MNQDEVNKDNLLEWENVFNTINDAITIHDAEFNIIKANKAAELLLGKTAQDILRNKCFESYHGTLCAPETCPSCNVLKTRKEATTEIYESNLGKFLEIKALPRLDDKNNLIGLVHVVRDITERKKIETELINAKNRAEEYLNIAGIMILGINPQKEVIVMNKKGAEILGYNRNEIIGKNFFKHFIPERLRDEVLNVSDKLFSGEMEPVEYYENPILNSRGQERMIAWHNTVLKDNTGKIIAHLSSGEDITERKKVDKELKAKLHDLEIFYKATVGRELQMKQLKEQINILKIKLAEQEKNRSK
jgi:PAS domain S-box-containing protein